ncbi:MAG: CpaF family protein [Bdellovibrionales bacterium]
MTTAKPLSGEVAFSALRDRLMPLLREKFPSAVAKFTPRADVAREAKAAVNTLLTANKIDLNLLDQRDLVTSLINGFIAENADTSKQAPSTDTEGAAPAAAAVAAAEGSGEDPYARNPSRASVEQAKLKLQPIVLERIDTSLAARLPREALSRDLTGLIAELLTETKIQLNAAERAELVKQLLDDMLGLGPLEPLLADESISEIMVNGAKHVFVENQGKLTLSDVQFRDNAHVLSIATRIVTAIGRRIDESSPLCDARLADGSRVNIIIPPLAIDGATITIRKFSKKKITLDSMLKFGSLSPSMAKVLRIAGRARLNILISGGTGSGKTTLLNALSQMIDHGERIVTIEDAAELQLQQPHVVRLETRPPNLEGAGEVTMRDLVKNALRMRPDRIIVGETRGGEALDMLQAMNTGHDGSMSTVHANRPREAIMRLENLVGMASANLSPRAIRQQIASAIDMIIQVGRLRDGSRRIVYITEITGMEDETITLQDLYTCEVIGEMPDGKLTVEFKNHGLRPHFLPKAAYFGLDRQLMETIDS